jgi:hypothetical protein
MYARDGIGSVLTEEQVGRAPSSLDDLVTILRDIPFTDAVQVTAWLGSVNDDTGEAPQEQLTVLKRAYGENPPVVASATPYIAQGMRALAEQQLFLMQRLAFDHCPNGVQATQAQVIARCEDALLAAATVATSLGDRFLTSDLEDALLFLVQSGAFYARDDLWHALGRSRDLLELSRRRGDLNLDDLMQSAYGVTAEEQFACAYGLAALSGHKTDATSAAAAVISASAADDVFSKVVPGREAAMRDLISADTEWYRACFANASKSLDSLVCDRVPVEQRPFLRSPSNDLLLLSPRALDSWMTDGFFHRAVAAAPTHLSAPPSAEARSLHVRTHYGHITEDYAAAVVEKAYSGADSWAKVRREVSYALPAGEAKSPDIAVLENSNLVFIEVCHSRLPQALLTAPTKALMRQALDNIYLEKLEQLGDRIVDFVASRINTLDIQPSEVTRIYPVLVTAPNLVPNPVLAEVLKSDVQKRLYDRDEMVQPLTLLRIHELECLAGLVESGWQMRQVLEAKSSSAYSAHALDLWTAHAPGAPDWQVPSYVSDLTANLHLDVGAALGLPAP